MAAGTATITATSEGQSGSSAITLTAIVPNPGTVSDLAVAGVTDTSVTLSFTEVSDGAGQPASDEIRWAVGATSWAAAADVTRGSCASPVAGTAIGAKRSCTVLGLAAATGYQFQLVAFRGTLNVNAVFGALSTVASGTTALDPPPVAVASVTVSPATASVQVGASAQLAASSKDASGNPLSGRVVTWASSAPAVATVNGSGLMSGVAAGTATITATSEGQSGTSAISVTAVSTNPGTVTDLSVAGVTTSGVTLAFTEVTDGTGLPASYDIRWAVGSISWGSAASGTSGTCATPVAGTAIGAKRTCTVLGLVSATGYQFQLGAFRGTLNVNAAFGALSTVASGTTAASTAPVASVTVSPASASVAVGQTLQLTATLKDASGVPLSGRVITWASSNTGVATVSGSGLVSGLVVSTATITATSEGQSGTAAITVTALPPPGTWPNEPAGWTVVTDYDMHALNDGGWLNVYPQDVVNGKISIAVDPAAPFSPPSVWQVMYPIGMASGSAPATVYYDAAYGQELYMGFWWKPSNPWQDADASGVSKIAFLFAQGGHGQMYIMMYGIGSPRRLVVETEFPGDNRNLYPNVNNPDPTLGVWHRIEIYARYSGGIVKWWMDGALVGSYTGVTFPSDAGFSTMEFSPTFGGNGSPKTENDYFWYDHVHISRP